MPNHVTTILKLIDVADPESLRQIRSTFVNEEGNVDFNVIVAMPECLRGFEPHLGIVSRAEMALGLMDKPGGEGVDGLIANLAVSNALRSATEEIKPDDLSALAQAISNYAETGFIYWYDWAVDNWGTKWNCYGQSEHPEDAIEFEFETAWSHPQDLIVQISRKNPGVLFEVQYADEDTGSNCGEYRVKDGELIPHGIGIAPGYNDQTPEQVRVFTEFAFRLRYGSDTDPRQYGYGEDWVYDEKVETEWEAEQKASA